MKPLSIAVAGAGLIGRRHAAIVNQVNDCVLHSIVDPSDGARALARGLDVPGYRALSDVFSDDETRPDGIILATPNHLHVEQGLACIEAGIPVLIEKPAADTLARGLELLDAATSKGAKVLVGHHRRYSAIIAKATEIIEAGALGRITSVVATELLHKPDDYFAGDLAWRTRQGGGPLLINLIHDIGNLRALAGEISDIHAFTSNATRGHQVEDTAAISLRFASGALGTISISDVTASDRNWEHTSGEDLTNFGDAQVNDVDCYLVAGTEGSLGIPSMRLWRFAPGVERSWLNPLVNHHIPTAVTDPLVVQIEHFCAVINGTQDPLVSLRDGLANLSVIEAIQQSAASGTSVTVPRI